MFGVFLAILMILTLIPSFWGYLAAPSSWTHAGVNKTLTSVIVLLGPFAITAIFLWKSEKAPKRLL